MKGFRSFFGLGPSDAEKQELNNQMSRLNRYIAENGVQVVQDDPNNPFAKIDDNKKLLGGPTQEYFLKIGENKYVSLGEFKLLDYNQQRIAEIFGYPASDYKRITPPFMNNYLFTRITRPNPQGKTLFDMFQIDSKKRTKKIAEINARKANDPPPLDKNLDIKSWDARIKESRIETKEAYQHLTSPEYCIGNFTEYLGKPFGKMFGNYSDKFKKYEAITIYQVLVDSLGSMEEELVDRFYREGSRLSDFSPVRDEIAGYARRQEDQQGFIRELCKNGNAVKILTLANSDYDGSGQGDMFYNLNVWKAFRLCLQQLEEYLWKKYLLPNPQHCIVNFRAYLRTPFHKILKSKHNEPIYEGLVESLGRSQGSILSDFTKKVLDKIVGYAMRPGVQENFIHELCKHENALQILFLANSEEGDKAREEKNRWTVKDIWPNDDTWTYEVERDKTEDYTTKRWEAFHICLKYLEEYMYKHLQEIQAQIQGGGGKLKSRSKSIRKKRISHRKKKSHSHKRRAPKRLTPKRRTVNQ